MHPALTMVEQLAVALGGSVVPVDELAEGDIELTYDGQVIGGYRVGGLDGVLGRLVETVEREMGSAIDNLDRAGKQEAVRRLDRLGAFTLRRAVEDIADRLKVSRFTVYNYLNASVRSGEEGNDQ